MDTTTPSDHETSSALPEPHVDPEEAALEGGLAEPEVQSTISGLVVEHARELIGQLLDSLSPSNAPRVLTQISKIAMSSRQTVALFDPALEVETEGLTRQQRQRIKASKRRMNRETAGVRAVQEIAAILGGVQQSLDARRGRDLLQAAQIARESGMDERADKLAEQADIVLGAATQTSPPVANGAALAQAAGQIFANQADRNERFNDGYLVPATAYSDAYGDSDSGVADWPISSEDS